MNIPQNVPRPNENHIVFWWQLHTNVGLLLETGTDPWRLAGRLLGFMIIAWLFVWEKTVIQCWSNQNFVVCWKALNANKIFVFWKKKLNFFLSPTWWLVHGKFCFGCLDLWKLMRPTHGWSGWTINVQHCKYYKMYMGQNVCDNVFK